MGSWVRYRAIADDPIANNQSETNSRFTAYEICRGRQDDRRLEANLINSEGECGAAQVEVYNYSFITVQVYSTVARQGSILIHSSDREKILERKAVRVITRFKSNLDKLVWYEKLELIISCCYYYCY